MNRTILETLCIAATVVSSMMGCATRGSMDSSPDVAAGMSEKSHDSNLEYTVTPGDQLGDIAAKITGSVSNWRSIAEFNQIDDPRLLRPGQVLTIPRELISVRRPLSSNAIPGDRRPTPGEPVGVPMPDSDITEVTLSTVADRPAPVESRPESDGAAEGRPEATRSVQVSGSYYPRGIYVEPSGSARLLLRASPGTLLPLERTIDNWYRVTTSQGTGYIRAGEARIVDSSATPGSTASSD